MPEEKVAFKKIIEGDSRMFEFVPPTKLFRKIGDDTNAIFLKLYDTDKSQAYWRNSIEIGSGKGYWTGYGAMVQQLEIVD